MDAAARVPCKPEDGVKKVRPKGIFDIKYTVSCFEPGRKVELPVHGGIYIPENLGGSCEDSVILQFYREFQI